jgi:hypothetical protein
VKQFCLALILLLAGCAKVSQIQRQYEDANSGFSPRFDPQKIYSLAILPPTSGVTLVDKTNLNGLYDFAGMTMLQTNHFVPVERTRIDAVLKEQEFGASGIVDPSTAAKLGKVLGADAVMLVTVASSKHNAFFDDPNEREVEMYVKVISSTTAEVLYYGRGEGTSFEGELDALQAGFQLAIGALKRKGGY